jgi:acetyl esterase/lipase
MSALVEAMLESQPKITTLDPAVVRKQSDDEARRTRVRVDEAVDRTIAGGIEARVFTPPTVESVYLYIHGGAWFMGAKDLADEMMWARAQRANTAVVSIDYRLAPEDRWPAQLDDCERAATWLVEDAASEFGSDRIVIGGDSAGAHLSVATLLALRDRHGITSLRGADLRYGMYDMRLTPGARQYPGRALNAETLEWCVALCFDQLDDPLVSPLLADLHGLPPALFTVGTNDSLLEDTLFMWTRWRAAGNDAELVIHPGAIHAFDYMPLPAAAKSIDDSVAFIRRVTS